MQFSQDLIKLAVEVTVGIALFSVSIYLFTIKINNQHSSGDKSPNISGDKNKVKIQ